VFDDARALTDLAANVAKSFRHAEAERYFRRAAALHRIYWRQDFGPALVDLAGNLEAQGRLADAEAMFAKAIALYPASPTPKDAEAAALRSRLAFVKFAQGKSEGVEATLNEALRAYESWYGPTQYKTSEALADLGWFLLKTKQFAKAEPYLARAAAIRETILGQDQPRTLQALQHVATTHLALNRPEQALTVARRVLAGRLAAGRAASQAANDALRNDIGARTGTAARTSVRAAWTVAARAPAQDPRLRAEAFGHAQAIEQSAAADALSRGAARLLAGRAGAGPFVRAWSDTLARIDWLTAKMTAAAAQGPKGDAERTRLAGDLRAAIAARDDAEKALAASYPAYFELLRPQSVPVAELQATAGENAKLLRSDEALILLYPGDAGMIEGQRNGLVFVVTKTATAWAEIAMAPDELKRHIATIHKQLAEGGATLKPGDEPESLQGFERQRAHLVYRALFADPKIQAALKGHPRWLLAPQGALVGLPFAVLVMAPPPGGEELDADPASLRKTAWLGLNRTLALVPSVGVLKLQRLKIAAAAPATPRFFGLGDPAFRGVPDPPAGEADDNATRAFVRRSTPRPGRDYFRSGAGDPKRIAELKRLPQTANEIRALAATLKAAASDFVLQVKATEAELRRRNQDRSLQQAEVIAFATHGLIAGDLQDTLTEPALVLTPPVLKPNEKPAAANDGLLTASEAAGLTLNADWVILSACNTASGMDGNAEGLTGLARAFLFAGARSLLVSHYPILDKSAMMLTTAAVANARDKRLRRPEALRAAMAKLLADTSRDAAGVSFAHPSAWAPFAIIDAT
jgi:CHAT domain-containing protein